MVSKLLSVDLSTDSKSLRAWYRNHVYRVCLFRTLLQELKKSSGKEQASLQRRFKKASDFLDRHDKRGKQLGLSDNQITEFNRLIAEKNSQDKPPKTIIQELGLSKKDESPPFSSGPIV